MALLHIFGCIGRRTDGKQSENKGETLLIECSGNLQCINMERDNLDNINASSADANADVVRPLRDTPDPLDFDINPYETTSEQASQCAICSTDLRRKPRKRSLKGKPELIQL